MLMKRMNERKQIKPHWYDGRKKRTEEMSGRDANTSGGRDVWEGGGVVKGGWVEGESAGIFRQLLDTNRC